MIKIERSSSSDEDDLSVKPVAKRAKSMAPFSSVSRNEKVAIIEEKLNKQEYKEVCQSLKNNFANLRQPMKSANSPLTDL
uniref:Uncharacterized protein n=1 Tax=Caenorhabditis japonica TaxID=281687 RepID=A0A8R1EQV5_CAEJA